MADLDLAFERWKTMAELQLTLVEKLGTYKLETAKTELVNAVAANQWETARIKAAIARELEAVLRRLNHLRYQTARRIQRLDRHAKAISKIRNGEDLSTDQLTLMWAAFRVFERLTPTSVLDRILTTPIEVRAKQGTSYVNVRHPDLPCDDPPESVDNVDALICWIKRKRYVPRRGTQAYRHVIQAITWIAEVANTEIQSLEDHLQQIEKGVYDAWQPVVLAALPDSVDVKKIIRLGTT